MRLALVLAFVALAFAASPEPQDTLAVLKERVNSVTPNATATNTRARLSQWANFLADVEANIPELSHIAKMPNEYQEMEFPALLQSTTTTTAVWNPFQPWITQLAAYKTYMLNYIDYQLTWVIKMKCAYTGDCTVKTTMSAATTGATVVTLGSVAGVTVGSHLTFGATASASAMDASFLQTEAAACSETRIAKSLSGNSVTLTAALGCDHPEGASVSVSSVAPSPAPAAVAKKIDITACNAAVDALADKAENGLRVTFKTVTEVPVGGQFNFHITVTFTSAATVAEIAPTATNSMCQALVAGADHSCGDGTTAATFTVSPTTAFTTATAAQTAVYKFVVATKAVPAGTMEFRLKPWKKTAATVMSVNVDTANGATALDAAEATAGFTCTV